MRTHAHTHKHTNTPTAWFKSGKVQVTVGTAILLNFAQEAVVLQVSLSVSLTLFPPYLPLPPVVNGSLSLSRPLPFPLGSWCMDTYERTGTRTREQLRPDLEEPKNTDQIELFKALDAIFTLVCSIENTFYREHIL
jgi:hypothetical protein